MRGVGRNFEVPRQGEVAKLESGVDQGIVDRGIGSQGRCVKSVPSFLWKDRLVQDTHHPGEIGVAKLRIARACLGSIRGQGEGLGCAGVC